MSTAARSGALFRINSDWWYTLVNCVWKGGQVDMTILKDYVANTRLLSDDRGRMIVAQSANGELKFGHVLTGTADAPEDLWWGKGDYPFPAAAGSVAAVSNNAADDAAGTGARTIRLVGLDADGNYLEQDITMGGVTPAAQMLAVNRAYVATAGSTGTNVGVITITLGGATVAIIDAAHGQTQQAVYVVPADWVGGAEINYIRISLVRSVATSLSFSLDVREPGGAWRRRYEESALNTAPFDVPIYSPIQVAPLSLVRLRILTVSAAGVDVYGAFSINQFDALGDG